MTEDPYTIPLTNEQWLAAWARCCRNGCGLFEPDYWRPCMNCITWARAKGAEAKRFTPPATCAGS